MRTYQQWGTVMIVRLREPINVIVVNVIVVERNAIKEGEVWNLMTREDRIFLYESGGESINHIHSQYGWPRV